MHKRELRSVRATLERDIHRFELTGCRWSQFNHVDPTPKRLVSQLPNSISMYASAHSKSPEWKNAWPLKGLYNSRKYPTAWCEAICTEIIGDLVLMREKKTFGDSHLTPHRFDLCTICSPHLCLYMQHPWQHPLSNLSQHTLNTQPTDTVFCSTRPSWNTW